jgi:hypothetical protein
VGYKLKGQLGRGEMEEVGGKGVGLVIEGGGERGKGRRGAKR